MATQLNYGNWIRTRILFILGFCTLAMGALSLLPFGTLYRLVVLVLFVILLISFLFPLYAYSMFSQRGGQLQDKFYNLIIQHLGTNVKGRVFDIGSGNGVLAVKTALYFPEVTVIGMDYWGEDWEYSKNVCDKNAQLAQVEKRVTFQKGDAAQLDFASETFDAATSNLTFHEVKSVADKRNVFLEALRVIKSGGSFAFIDYFFDESHYGERSDFQRFLGALNLKQVEHKRLREILPIPFLLNHPKILGKVGIIYGRK